MTTSGSQSSGARVSLPFHAHTRSEPNVITEVSANGMRQRVAKLKTMSKTQLEACSGGESGSKDETPKASPKATPKSNSGSKRKSATTSAEEDEETVEKTPSKKRATTKAAGTPAPKGRGRKSKKDSVSAEAEEEKEVIKAEDVKAKDDAALQVDGGADDDDVAI